MSKLSEAAMEYAKAGFYIFPCVERDKKPITQNGVKDASKDVDQITRWWSRYPNANIGLATGPNNLVVIDIDVDEEKGEDGRESIREWEKTHAPLPDTCMSITGRGGYHWLYRTNEKFKNRVGIIEGVDVRAEGGYIVAPPSVHPSGREYTWEVSPFEEEIAQVDENVRFFLNTGSDIQATEFKAPDQINSGCRNTVIFKLACSLQSKGLADESISDACRKENLLKCKPPLSDQEVETIVKSVLTKYKKRESIIFRGSGEVITGAHEPILKRNSKGNIMQTKENAVEAVEYDPELYLKFQYNRIAYNIYVCGSLPWDSRKTLREIENIDLLNLESYIESKYELKNEKKIDDALDIVAHHYQINPVTELLEKIRSDYKDKDKRGAIRRLLPKYLGADDTDYTYEVMKVFMLGAISRAYRPGCKFDYMVVLTGDQGIGKSSFFKYLAFGSDIWYDDNFNTIEGKAAAERLRGKWIVEMAELLATKKAKEIESIKAFITSTADTYRVPFARITESRPRVCVFAGTTNDDAFLTDRTGNRRFLPIKVHAEKQIIHPMESPKDTAEDISLAWAEAMDFFYSENMEPDLRLPLSVQAAAEDMQAAHTEEDPLVGIVSSYLEKFAVGEKICAAKILVEAVGLEKEKVNRQETKKIHTIMQNIPDWKKCDKQKKFEQPYGTQQAYEKIDVIVEEVEEVENNELPL